MNSTVLAHVNNLNVLRHNYRLLVFFFFFRIFLFSWTALHLKSRAIAILLCFVLSLYAGIKMGKLRTRITIET